jgi:hypothetical protein
MESTLQKPSLVAARTTAKAGTIAYWIVTALFCLQMSFTSWPQLRLPQVTERPPACSGGSLASSGVTVQITSGGRTHPCNCR